MKEMWGQFGAFLLGICVAVTFGCVLMTNSTRNTLAEIQKSRIEATDASQERQKEISRLTEELAKETAETNVLLAKLIASRSKK